MNRLLAVLLIVACCGCSQNTTDKHQGKRDNVINVHDRVREIETGDILISRISRMCLADNYLLICDYEAYDNQIHLFDKNTYAYITGTAPKGQGPGEMANIGYVSMYQPHKYLYVTDHGKQKLFRYELDSILSNPYYLPETVVSMVREEFPNEYLFLNDTLALARIIQPTGNSGFKQRMGKWNIKTGEIILLEDMHPEIVRARTQFDVSMENGIFVQFFSYRDLFSICTLDGELVYNVYGHRWDDKDTFRTSFFGGVSVCKNRIIAEYYDGMDTYYTGTDGRVRSNYPTKLIVFDLEGEYIKTLDTGYRIGNFCYDADNNRIIMNFDDEIQFGYLDLYGLID